MRRLFNLAVGFLCTIWGAQALGIDPYGAIFFYLALANIAVMVKKVET